MKFRFQRKVCDGCHDMIQKSMSFDYTVSITMKGHGYRINFWFMAKSEAIDKMKDADLSEISGQL